MKHTVGFIASIALMLLAVYVTLYTSLTFHAKLTIIFGFAFIQAGLQLLMFMHLTEGKDGRLQTFKVIFALVITLCFVVGTYWSMKAVYFYLKKHFIIMRPATRSLAGFYFPSIFKWLSPLLYLKRQSLLSIQLIHSYTIIYIHFYIDIYINCLYLFNLTQILSSYYFNLIL